MRKNSLTIVVFAVAIISVAFTTVRKNEVKEPSEDKAVLVDYYFRFDGDDGQEDDESLWIQIGANMYNLGSCNQPYRGCMLKTTSITGTSGAGAHPSVVNVTGTAPNISPTIGGGVIEVKNRVASY
jgi:hypothetical protein